MPDVRLNARDITASGSAIYDRRYRSDYEAKWRGQFAAIDVNTEKAFVADFPDEAFAQARSALPGGLFYLVRIGFPGAYKTSRRASAHQRIV